MKFRTKIVNPSILFKIGQALEKVHKTWVLKLGPDRIQFIIANPDQGLQTYSQINLSHVFDEYRIESLNQNQILLEVPGEHWVRSLRSAQQTSDTMMKLTKKNGLPILSLSITTNSRTGKSMYLIQDIPVRVLTQDQAQDLREPKVPEPEVNIIMPSLLSVRNIVDRMKALSNDLTVSANNSGEFTLRAETDLVSVETFYKDLINPEIEIPESGSRESSSNKDPKAFVECNVDVKEFAKFSHCHLVGPSNVVCCIIQDRNVVLYVYLVHEETNEGLGSMTYYLPFKQK
ncbi:checkpoint protein Hus1/Mec3 [Zopfochytrium polystomum]|nr:checkpoint protein Hus1/Mec3 [Zopfochytrium polystomum]